MNTDKIYAEQLANEYAPKDTSKVLALKKLDAKAKRPANIFAYSFGTLSALVMGVGMCLCMGQIGPGGAAAMAIGVVIGLVGMLGVGVNYHGAMRHEPITKRPPRNAASAGERRRKIPKRKGTAGLSYPAVPL